jgi:hypothetical protein
LLEPLIGSAGRKPMRAVSKRFQNSNGVVEGHVNRLKLIKRMMYGRARFPLLRQRVLHYA